MTAISLRRTTKPRPRVLRQALQEHTRAAYREAILTAAEKIILRDGYQSAKMADIAEATGVSVGTLYNYFESKEAVLVALTDHHKARFHAYVEQPFDSDDPLLQLRQLVGRANDFVEQNGALFNLYVQSKANGHDPHGAGAASCLAQDNDHEKYSSLIMELLNRGIKAGKIRSNMPVTEMVWALHSTMQALLWDWCRQPNSFSLKQRGDEFVTLFLEGAGTR